MTRLFLAAGGLLATLLCLAGLLALPGERAALGVPNAKSNAFVSYAANGRLAFGISDYSKRLLMSDCSDVAVRMANEPSLSTSPDAVATRANCLAATQQIIARSPINAFAWVVQARLFAADFKIADFLASLKESHRAGPYSLLAAKTRVDISRLYQGFLDDETKILRDKDLLMLGATRDGSLWLAQLYAKDETFRPVIIAALETLPADDKAKFLRNARKQMEILGAGT